MKISKMKVLLFVLTLMLGMQMPAGMVYAAPCEPGTFSETGNDPCTPCDAGKFQDDSGQTVCETCDGGTYQPDTGQITCINCPVGTSAPDEGSATCTDCAAGSYQSFEGATTCVTCEPGTYSEEGQETCTNCAPGSYTEEIATAVCSLCPAGTFQSNEASIDCLPCLADTYSEEGAAECSDCPTGGYSEEGAAECFGVCLDSLTFVADEDCDDGNMDLLDGCTEECAYETNNDLAEVNTDITFSALELTDNVVVVSPNHPTVASVSRAVVAPAPEEEPCTCVWTVNPPEVAGVSDTTDCVITLEPLTTGPANLSVAESCPDTGEATFNQTIIVGEDLPDAAPAASSSGGCSLQANR